MLKLILDVGNTQLKVFLFENNTINNSIIFQSEHQASEFIKTLDISHKNTYCIISRVRSISEELNECLRMNTKRIEFSYTLNLPFKITYHTPETLGNDRIAGVAGASVLFPDENVLVIDAGTAITYDILEKGDIYPGGNISPGLSTRFKSLNTFTEKLPLININKDKTELFGKTTTDAIICGIQNGILHEVSGVIADFEQNYQDLKVVFTGGDCFFFEKLLKKRIFVSPNLIGIGLNKILELNV